MAATSNLHTPSLNVVPSNLKMQQINSTKQDVNDGVSNPNDPVKQSADASIPLSSSQVVITSLIAGAVAGALAKTTIAPLDRTKINFQIRQTPYSAKAAWNFLVNTAKTEGIAALWRGNSATMARILPYAAIQFTAHEQWKILFGVADSKQAKRSPILLFLSGSLAGITSQSLTYPLDLARARMAVTSHFEYKSLWHVFTKMWHREGWTTLYRGYWPTILGVIPYAGVSFFTYDSLKHFYEDRYGVKQPALVNLLFGGIAGIAGQSSSYPLDIVRRRMQTAKMRADGSYQYKTIIGTLQKIYREEGVKGGFFKGLSMNWVKGPIAVGISFASYDSVRQTLRDVCVVYNTSLVR
ncbi:dephosphocoenzyme A carrier [Arctopsyche grandis]|uniref:dephosphocoenzyme A carrier n=1 Tax=Arctopsyche grandis TaxID=121162 RepID=UPI00406D8A83